MLSVPSFLDQVDLSDLNKEELNSAYENGQESWLCHFRVRDAVRQDRQSHSDLRTFGLFILLTGWLMGGRYHAPNSQDSLIQSILLKILISNTNLSFYHLANCPLY